MEGSLENVVSWHGELNTENSTVKDPHTDATERNLDAILISENQRNEIPDAGVKADNIVRIETGAPVSADSSLIPTIDLETETEILEAPVIEDGVRNTSPLATDQKEEQIGQGFNEPPTEETQGDRKRTMETPLPERRSKRGRKAQAIQVPREEEDVCFVCFDGGKLILCDRRACPKAYHVECTGRDTEFFNKRGSWFCGWHFCGLCTRSATTHCYTCPNAFCNNCISEADFLVIRKSRGLCEVCFPIVKMIEHNEIVDEDGVKVDFEDKETYECLYKEYWEGIKEKLSLTWAELDKAHKAKEAGNQFFADDKDAESNKNDGEPHSEDNNESSSDSDGGSRMKSRRYSKRKRLTRASVGEDESESDHSGNGDEGGESGQKLKRGRTRLQFDGWASKDLLDFIQFRKEDPKKPLSRIAVNKLLWSYIEINNLQDQRKRSQIICDERLQKLFGKKNVGRFEMMKLLSSHIAPKQVNAVKLHDYRTDDEEIVILDNNDTKGVKVANEKQRKSKKKLDENKYAKPDPNDFAAINVNNINLIYLRRSLLEDLLNDPEFNSKVIGAFVRIRVPSMVNKSDMCYRLVQVVGIKLLSQQETIEKRMTDVILEILNLQKREEVTVDLVSNQDFTEEECLRLRQSVKCGFIKAMTVGELEEKAKSLQEVKVKDWFETELLKLSHLRDRASEKGRKRELRECVQKLQLLSSPGEKERRLKAPQEIMADPHMDPAYESDNEATANNRQVAGRAGDSNSSWGKEHATRVWEWSTDFSASEKISSQWEDSSQIESYTTSGAWDSSKAKASSWGQKDLGADKEVDYINDQASNAWNQASIVASNEKESYGFNQESHGWSQASNVASNEKESYGWNQASSDGWNQASSVTSNEKEVERVWGNDSENVTESSGWNTHSFLTRKDSSGDGVPENANGMYRVNGQPGYNKVEAHSGTPSFERSSTEWSARREQTTRTSVSTLASVGLAGRGNSSQALTDEKEKIWHYQDPSGRIQGPFSMEQLRKWEKTKLFPLDLQIWRTTEHRNESILLTDALVGKFSKNIPLCSLQSDAAEEAPSTGWGPTGKDLRILSNRFGSDRQEKSDLKFSKSVLLGSMRSDAAEEAQHTGWATTVKDMRSLSNRSGSEGQEKGDLKGFFNRFGSDRQEKSGKSGWDQNEFAEASTWDTSKDCSTAWGAGGGWSSDKTQTSLERSSGDDGWGPFTSTESAWGSQLPAEISKAVEESWGSGQEQKSGGWEQRSLTTEAGAHGKGSFKANWKREFHPRDSDQYRNERSGIEPRNPRRKDIPCKFHLKGFCRHGPDCDFKH